MRRRHPMTRAVAGASLCLLLPATSMRVAAQTPTTDPTATPTPISGVWDKSYGGTGGIEDYNRGKAIMKLIGRISTFPDGKAQDLDRRKKQAVDQLKQLADLVWPESAGRQGPTYMGGYPDVVLSLSLAGLGGSSSWVVPGASLSLSHLGLDIGYEHFGGGSDADRYELRFDPVTASDPALQRRVKARLVALRSDLDDDVQEIQAAAYEGTMRAAYEKAIREAALRAEYLMEERDRYSRRSVSPRFSYTASQLRLPGGTLSAYGASFGLLRPLSSGRGDQAPPGLRLAASLQAAHSTLSGESGLVWRVSAAWQDQVPMVGTMPDQTFWRTQIGVDVRPYSRVYGPTYVGGFVRRRYFSERPPFRGTVAHVPMEIAVFGGSFLNTSDYIIGLRGEVSIGF